MKRRGPDAYGEYILDGHVLMIKDYRGIWYFYAKRSYEDSKSKVIFHAVKYWRRNG